MEPALLDTDTLSEVMKGHDLHVQEKARECTRYEILRGLKAKGATQQIAAFEGRCRQSHVVPLTDEIIVRAADVYADLYRKGQLISDADILLAATALIHGTILVTENAAHFSRIPGLRIQSWRDV